MTKIIGICGAMRSGKTTAANHLVKTCGLTLLPMAAPLKAMLRAIGLSKSDTDGPNKAARHPLLCGHTPRYAMQTLGTEWGRNLIGTDFWLNIWIDHVNRLRMEGAAGIVCDDIRFADEAKAITDLGGTVWRMGRKEAAVSPAHVSEIDWWSITPDVEIDNNGSLADLRKSIDFLSRPFGLTPLEEAIEKAKR